MKIIILAGGSGTRLWPVSRKSMPKQVQPFVDDQTLLQKSYQRLLKGFRKEDIFIATCVDYKSSIIEQLPQIDEKNILCEPEKKDTAAAVGFTALHFYHSNQKEIIITVHSDHYIENEVEYLRILRLAGNVIERNPEYGGLVGVNPTYAETGYGYIKMNGQLLSVGNDEIFKVERFIEKPDRATAEELIKQWEYLWNPGYFIWRVDALLAQYQQFLPKMYEIFMKINAAIGTSDADEIIKKEFAKIDPISIDYGIMEKAKNLIVIPADLGFADIGHWKTIKDVLKNENEQNIKKGTIIEVDCSNNLIYNFSSNIVSTAGLRDMIVVVTQDATLVCHQDSAQDVKKIVEKIKELGLDKYL
ncbi:MAG: sugar phosphate nucleotidyltransferase [bacterium]|nr:sugar phosphate nucleotidyltransferase [bacterium]